MDSMSLLTQELSVRAQDLSDQSQISPSVYRTLVGFGTLFIIFAIVSIILWIWAMIDTIYRDFPAQNEKLIWIIALLLGFFILGPVIPIVYLIVRNRRGTIKPR